MTRAELAVALNLGPVTFLGKYHVFKDRNFFFFNPFGLSESGIGSLHFFNFSALCEVLIAVGFITP